MGDDSVESIVTNSEGEAIVNRIPVLDGWLYYTPNWCEFVPNLKSSPKPNQGELTGRCGEHSRLPCDEVLRCSECAKFLAYIRTKSD